MKKAFILLTALSLSVLSSNAQGQIEENFKLDRKMASLQEAIENEPSVVQTQVDELVKTFPYDWRSYYWSAYTTYKSAQAIEDEKTKIDKLKKAEGWLKRAESIGVENSEIELLKAFIDYEKIITNPEVLTAKYLPDLNYHISEFEKYNIESPRFYLLKGIMAINDTLEKPENFDIAGDYFSGAQMLFEDQPDPNSRKNYADPFWGKQRVETYMLLFGSISKGPVESGMEDVMEELEADIENKREGSDAEPEVQEEEAEETQEESIEAAQDEIDAAIEEIGEEDSKKEKKKKKSKKEKKKKKSKKDKK